MAIKASTGSRAPAFWLRLALLHAFLLDRSAASFAKSGTGPSVVATSGSFSPPDLSEPNELDLLDDSEMPGVPQEQELRSDFNEDVRDKEEQFLKSEHLWAFLSFIIGYVIVQYVLGGSRRDPHTKEE
ncbi:unnamed protein product [Cladocopium goreaui]|uniref:Uncharacterized protein n=1 Tax=Cladocopium goreaui TaxID=2562237 RepID=A0A9P1CIK5_9DINO|nr:unnamed protein product [Cladocopium goreaui]